MELQGKLTEIFATQSINDRFRKREFVLEYAKNPEYPELLKFELIQENCEQLDQCEAGQTITVLFDLKGRKWTSPKGEIKYFNTLQAWRIKTEINDSIPTPSEPYPLSTEDGKDDLPF